LSLEDVPAGEPYAALDVGRPEHLVLVDAIADVRRVDRDLVEEQSADFVAPRVPVALRQLVGGELGEHTHHLAARRHDRVVTSTLLIRSATLLRDQRRARSA